MGENTGTAAAVEKKEITLKFGKGLVRNFSGKDGTEWAKVLMDEMAAEAGIETFFHSWGVDVIQDGNAILLCGRA